MEKRDNPRTYGTDVAMFIDWENMHGCIRGKANVSTLREVAEGYGRLVLAKAYADWREPRFHQDSVVLYQIGFDPIYVPPGFKNNVDVKLATECIDCAYRYPNIGVYVLVSGDGDFVHVVTTLRPLGKQVVVIAQSNNVSSRLGDLVDTLLIYDRDVNPADTAASPRRPQQQQPIPPRQLDKVYRDVAEIIRQEEGAPILLSNVKQKLIRAYGSFDQVTYGFEKFKAMMEAGAKAGHFVLNTAGLRDWRTLPQEDTRVAQTELPEDIEQIFDDIVGIIRASPRPGPLFPAIKDALTKKYGGFDEFVYGYSRFKQMMEEGERLGYFQLGMTDKLGNYACLPSDGE